MRKKDIVTFDLASAGTLNTAQRAELKRLSAQPEDQIDTSDIQILGEGFWRNAARNPFYRPMKQQLTVRVDADVLAWLRSTGKGYQTKLNAILRRAMTQDVTKR